VTSPEARTVAVWRKLVPFRVHVKGQGPAVVFFHGPWGVTWDAFLDALARRFTVYAPEHPGTTPGEPETIQHVQSLWDLVLCYDELLDQLGVSTASFVGHSFGAMVACEVAALRPSRVGKLALLDPIGFWRDDAPVVNWTLVAPAELPKWVFHDPDGAAAKKLFAILEDREEAALARTRLSWAMGCADKFVWPIPDKGLKRRIHRIEATPTLLMWGEHDRLVPLVYEQEFRRHLTRARVEIVKRAGHAPHLEQAAEAATVVAQFLAG